MTGGGRGRLQFDVTQRCTFSMFFIGRPPSRCVPSVVYFGQQRGASHTVFWLKQSFWLFNIFFVSKGKKRKIKEKLKKTQKEGLPAFQEFNPVRGVSPRKLKENINK